MNTLPTHIQRSHYTPDFTMRERDKHLGADDIALFEKNERMVLRGPGKIGNPGCDVVAVFTHCPDDLMEALIYRYNKYNWLEAERKRLQAVGKQRIRATLAAMFSRGPGR